MQKISIPTYEQYGSTRAGDALKNIQDFSLREGT